MESDTVRQIETLTDTALIALHDRLHEVAKSDERPVIAETHHLVAEELRSRGLDHDMNDDSDLHKQQIAMSTVTVPVDRLTKMMSEREAKVVTEMAMRNGTSYADVYEILSAAGWSIRAVASETDSEKAMYPDGQEIPVGLPSSYREGTETKNCGNCFYFMSGEGCDKWNQPVRGSYVCDKWSSQTSDRLPQMDLDGYFGATASQIKVGTSVQYTVPKPPGPSQRASGIVTSITSDGTVRAGQEQREASQDNPVARIKVYFVTEDDEFVESDRTVIRNVSELRVFPGLKDRIKKQVSENVAAVLRGKVKEHNDKVGDTQSKRATQSMLEAVFRRGIGAYRTNPSSVRPNVSSAEQWAYARVNGFLHALRTGRFKRTPYDTDLLPKGHPYSRKAVEPVDAVDAAEPVESGWGREYEKAHEAGVLGALSHLMSAYKTSVVMGLSDLAQEIHETAVDMVEAIAELGVQMSGYDDDDDLEKGHQMKQNPVECLVDAFKSLLRANGMDDFRTRIMELIHFAEETVYVDLDGDGDTEPLPVELPRMSDDEDDDDSEPVEAMIREENNQYCVYSEDGSRSFGCYDRPEEANARLAQIERFSKATFVPPKAVQLEGQRAQQWISEGHAGKGFTDVGRARATQLARRAPLSERTVRRMKAYFGRHENDQKAEGFKPGEDGYPSPGRVAWAAWGGDAGKSWANRIVRQLDRQKEEKSLILKAETEKRYTLGPWYVPGSEDAHGEWTDDKELQNALWDYVRKGNRDIRLQHTPDTKAGEWVEAMSWPFSVEVPMMKSDGTMVEKRFPAGTVFLGVVWEPWAWDMVRKGQITGYSIGGTAKRTDEDPAIMATVTEPAD